MGKVTSTAPDHLTMNLFAPGMSALHRAGLGGLACTLKAMERQYAAGTLRNDKLPAPYEDDNPPWKIDEQTVTLQFRKPEKAGKYFEKLFGYAFEVRKDGLISLPGQYDIEPSAAVLADLQAGLTLTFLQHGRVRTLAKESSTASYDPEGEGLPALIVQFRKCSRFKHQGGWKDFVDKNGCLVSGMLKVDGPLSPGAVVRHVQYTADTAAEDPPQRMLPLYFAIIGCLPLPVNRGVAALLVPDVENLMDFIYDRPAMTPTTAKQCLIASAADAALQAQIRLRAKHEVHGSAIPGCYAMTFRPTPWASQQKSRVETIYVPRGDDRVLNRFERALASLPTRVVTRTTRETTRRGRRKIISEREEAFRADSIVRPLVAENLALGQPWYHGFLKLMTRTNPATNKPYRNQLSFERKGLHDMISDETMWDTAGEKTVVQAVHEAMRCRYGQIANENKNNPVAMKNRFSGEYDKWRLAFAGAKTVDQFRKALCDLFSRAGSNSVLKQSWQEVLPMLQANTWQQARDLALLGLCSYQGRSESETDEEAPQPKSMEDNK
jgi:CRISPR-associated protein Cas8a1/Csx13